MYSRIFTKPLSHQKSFFLFGPRGTGKTTWLRQKLPNAVFIDLLHYDYYRSLSSNPGRLEKMISSLPPRSWVVLDEIQRVPELLNEVHRLIETKQLLFAMTGSSARKLRRAGVNLLAGRALMYHFFPLTVEELSNDFDLEHSLHYGHLPATFSELDIDQYLECYVMAYLREEVMQEGLTRNIGSFSQFLEVASFSQGSVITMSDIAREAQISQKQVASYFSILEDLLLAHRLPVFTKHSKRRMISRPKFYFFDVGVYQSIRPKSILDQGAESEGVALESLCFQELMAQNHYHQGKYQLYYWRTSHGQEVDFVLHGPKGLVAIEIKRAESLRSKDLNGLRAFSKDYPMAKLFCFYGGSIAEQEGEITILPFDTALKQLKTLLDL